MILRHPASAPVYPVCYDPATATVALTVASTALSAVGSMAQGNAQAAQANYQADLQKRDAEMERRKAGQEEVIARRRGDALRSRQRSLFAASGVDTSEGSPLAVAEQTATDIEMDALAIRYGGVSNAQRLESSARLSEMEAKAAKRKGMFNAAGSILSAAPSFKFGNTATLPGAGGSTTYPRSGTTVNWY